MKSLFTLLVALIPLFSFSQELKNYQYIGIGALPMDADSKKVTYTGVLDLNGKGAESLYESVLVWVTKKQAEINQIKTKEAGSLINGLLSLKAPGNNSLVYTYIVEFKDGKARYTLKDFLMVYSGGHSPLETYYPSKSKGRYASNIDQEIASIDLAVKQEIDSLFKALTAQRGDW